jgi:uncharacterized RDD family membrane protein YckC
MICSKCGDFCQCPMEPLPNQSSASDSTTAPGAVVLARESSNDDDSEAWRDELSARLNRYRSRRKAPPPRYPSLQLPLGPAVPVLKTPVLEHTTSYALESSPLSLSVPEAVNDISRPQPQQLPQPSPPSPHVPQAGAKIIEFPRFAWGPPPPPPDQLAEPVIDRPRILEVPELAPPPPALGGITIEPTRATEPERRLGVDVPLQSAPLGRRLAAALIDGIIIAAAAGVFGLIFWKIALVRPPHIQVLTLAAGIPCLFWAAYYYLLIVYAGATPGLHLAGLQLSRFDGTPTKRSLRRWRVLASYLSAASLGMGYAWLFLDEDSLCWHDRITHTYLAPRRQNLNT